MRIRIAALSVALFLGAASGQASAAETPRADLRTAVKAYSKAFLTGDARTAYALLSKKCRTRTPYSQFDSGTNLAADLYGYLPITTYKATISGDRATVTYTYAVRKLNQSNEPWIYVNGWRNNDC